MEEPINAAQDEEIPNAAATAMDDERAAAVAEVAAMADVEATDMVQRPNGNRGGGTRANDAADEALQVGDLQNIDGPGSEVQNMFMEFLFGL